MKVLSVNAGSSSLKFQMYEMPEEKVLISGVFERIGIDAPFYTIKINGEKIKGEPVHPDFDTTIGFGGSAYLVIGGTFELGINLENFIDNVIIIFNQYVN